MNPGVQTAEPLPKRRQRRKPVIRITVTVLLCVLFLASCRTKLTPLPPEHQRTFQSLLEWSHKNGMPGAILLVRMPGREFIGVTGEADLKRHTPMLTNHAFQIASITKTFIGLVAAQMHADGKLDLDGCITNWLPREISARFQYSDRITLRHLLEHTSGIPDMNDRFRYMVQRGFLRPHGDWSPARQLKYAYDRAAKFEPGKGWSYCNAGYLLAALIIERVTLHHQSEEIRQRILTPLQLTNTYYLATESPRGQMAHGYESYFRWWRMDTTHWSPAVGGAAGLASTVSDLATFIRAVARDDGFLSPHARAQFLRDWSNAKKRYFLGIQRMRPRPDAPWFIGHSGGTPGYHSFAFHQPERDITIVYFGSSCLWKARGMSRLLDEFYETFRNALFEQTLKESVPQRQL